MIRDTAILELLPKICCIQARVEQAFQACGKALKKPAFSR